MMDLIRRLKDLDASGRIEISRALAAMMAQDAADQVKDESIETQYNTCVEIVRDLFNVDRDLLESRTRYYPLPNIRACVAYTLWDRGFNCSCIGRVMQRDHTTVISYIQKIEDVEALPRSNRELSHIWKLFREVKMTRGI